MLPAPHWQVPSGTNGSTPPLRDSSKPASSSKPSSRDSCGPFVEIPLRCSTLAGVTSLQLSTILGRLLPANPLRRSCDTSDSDERESHVLGRSSVLPYPCQMMEVSLSTARTISFEDKALRRASPIDTLLHGHGKIFADSKGDPATYAMSQETSRIDWFISHNWATQRSYKFFSLALFFNLKESTLLAILAMVVAFMLTAKGAMPMYKFQGWDYSQRGCFCLITGQIVQLLFIFTVHETTRWCMSPCRPLVFLDKTCIHQTDLERKALGISKLAAFIRSSRGVLVIYSDLYLRKLWTVYEITMMVLVNPSAEVFLLSIFFPWLIFTAMTVVLIQEGLRAFVFSEAVSESLGTKEDGAMLFICTVFPYLLTFTFITLLFRGWRKHLDSLEEILSDFSLENAKCACEEDREIVQKNIVRLMRDFGFTPRSTCAAEALQVFDTMVRTELPMMIRVRLGRVCLPYRFIICSAVSMLGYYMDTLSSTIYAHVGLPLILLTATQVFAILSLAPNMCAIMSWNSKLFLQAEGWLNTATTLFILILSGVECVSIIAVWQALEVRARKLDVVYINAYLAYVFANCCVTVLTYRQRPYDTPKRSSSKRSSRRSSRLTSGTSEVSKLSCATSISLAASSNDKEASAKSDTLQDSTEFSLESIREVVEESPCLLGGGDLDFDGEESVLSV